MAASVPSFKLNTGATIPAIGLGTWQAKPGEVKAAVSHALKSGYRHIDGALCYQNEKEVGEGIKESGVPRSEIFLTSKVWSSYHDRVEECLDQTLSDLGTDYLDLYLIHWPVRLAPNGTHPLFPVKEDGSRNIDWEWDQSKTWEQMESVLSKGKVKAIGISNCGIPIIQKLLKEGKVKPAVNQVELHPYNPEHELVKFCQDNDILVQAYSPLGSTSSPLHKDESLTKIAEKHNQSTATILLSYLVSKNIVVLPKSVTPSRIESNLKTIKLDQNEIDTLDKLAESGKQTRVNSPPWGSDFGFPHWYGPNNKNAPEGARLLAGKSA
ncbi:uncharacterized protein L201_003399 [Kwoniella dendrophila CBS 6074]|uniref:NADP-dependent oxidoreductase domain-containing protein n=1 Tax=Kwoniella dendrophila CBS 6074 TaxID=1295534 RepID=A0AAX4JUC4_9TREE